MYTVRKVALLALTLSSPALAGLLPPPVECVDGKPVGVNLPVATLPDPFTIQAISTGDAPGSLPLVLGEQLGTSDFTRIRMGATSKNPGLSFNLTDNQVYYTEDLFLTSVKSNGYGNTLDLGIGPGFPLAGLQFNAEYVCRSDDTPVLVLESTGSSGDIPILVRQSTGSVFDSLDGIEPRATIQIQSADSDRSTVYLSVIGGGDEVL